MPLSGIIYGSTNNKYITCYISWSAVQNKTENYSDVTANLYYSRTNSGYTTYGTWNGSININGTVGYASRSISISYNSNTFAVGNTVRVYHNNDGKKSIYISVSGGINGSSLSSTSCGGTIVLDEIPRASSLSCSNTVIGNSAVISINKADSSYTDTVTYSFGSLSGTLTTDTLDTSITWVIPDSFYAEIPNESQKICVLTTTTKNGGTTLGSNTYNFTISVDTDTSSPTLSPSVKDTNTFTVGLTGNEDVIVKYHSTVTAITNAEARNSASLASQTINNIETTGTTVFTNAQVNQFVITAKDSRGLITSETVTKNLIDYFNLTSSISVTIPTTDGEVTLKTQGLYFNGSFGSVDNQLISSYRINENGTWGNWITFTPTITDNSYSATVNITGLNYRYPYYFEVKVEDKLSTSSSVSQTVRAIPLFEWDDSSFDFHITPTVDSLPLVIGDSEGNVPITKGGTGGATAQEARENLSIALRPKLLWSGNWTSGSLTVKGISDYSFCIALTGTGAIGDVPFFMFLSGSSYRVYGASSSSTGSVAVGRFGSQNGDTLTFGGSSLYSITKIYGFIKTEDID